MCATVLWCCTLNLDNFTQFDFPVDNYGLMKELCTGLCLDRLWYMAAKPIVGFAPVGQVWFWQEGEVVAR